MKLNMKPGELGVVISGNKSSGRIVRVEALMEEGSFAHSTTGELFEIGTSDMWVLSEGTVMRFHENGIIVETEFAEDKYLRPIRDHGGEDETLTWAGKPEKVTA
ncbi:hypothetical protein [Comamonas testosteroni]|nr:hypothetical protein [Comamonas testosteroni]